MATASSANRGMGCAGVFPLTHQNASLPKSPPGHPVPLLYTWSRFRGRGAVQVVSGQLQASVIE